MAGTHDTFLVVLSILVAVAASYTALDLAGRVRAARGWAAKAWLATAAVAMGGGIWSMHFVAMLAFSLPGVSLGYDPQVTVLSLVIAIAVTALAFVVVSREGSGPWALAMSGVVMGLGIAGMHYTGMAAMRMHAQMHHEGAWIAISVLIAIGASTTALWLAFRNARSASRLAAALVMGLAVSGMHYAAMRGSVFHAHAASTDDADLYGLAPIGLALAVAAATFVILFLAVIASSFDRRFAELATSETKALRASEERFRTLYRMTPLPLHSLDDTGTIRQVSDAWLDLLGYAREAVIGRHITEFMTEASARQHLQVHWPKLTEQNRQRDIECCFVTKSGEPRDLVFSSRAERDERGVFAGALYGLVDVTARKRAEEALRQTQKIEAIGQLTGGIAHDFNNLLAVVLGNLELVRKRLVDDERGLRLLDNTVQGARRGVSLTQRLLAFSRRQDLKPAPVSIAALVHGMAELLQRAIGPQVRIDAQFPLDLPKAMVDANQFELALLNLAVNARDAMPEGGMITVSAERHQVETFDGRGIAPGAYLRVLVVDTGEGMDEATLLRAHEPFFTTKGLGKGTGLGLSMVHGLAEQSGGKLFLTSEPGRGTSAEIWLPAASDARQEAEEAASAANEPVPEAGEIKRRLLVVDDDLLVLSSTTELLEDLGYVVLQASSGQEALTLLASTPGIDLLLTDHAMPGMTGSQLAATVRETHPELPIILASGYSELSAEARLNLHRLQKPFDQRTLHGAIDMQLASRDATIIPFRARQV